MKKETSSLGSRLRKIRKEKEISQKDLAKTLGVTQGYISRIENDLTSPTLALVKKLRAKFKVNLNRLI